MKSQNIKILLPIIFLLISLNVSAQRPSFKAIKKYASEVYNIDYKKPKGFIDLKTSHWLRLGEDNSGYPYEPIFQSPDQECIIMYPEVKMLEIYWVSARNKLRVEIKSVLGKKGNIDFDKYITINENVDAQKCFNADTVFTARFNLKKAYKERYNYCTSLVLQKKDRPPLFIKLLFTEEGKLQEEKYLKALCKRIRYKEGYWAFDREKADKAAFEILYKGSKR